MAELQVMDERAQGRVEHDAEILQVLGRLAQGEIPPLRATRRAAVRWALARTAGNVSHAAEMLQISRGTIYRYAR